MYGVLKGYKNKQNLPNNSKIHCKCEKAPVLPPLIYSGIWLHHSV